MIVKMSDVPVQVKLPTVLAHRSPWRQVSVPSAHSSTSETTRRNTYLWKRDPLPVLSLCRKMIA